MPGRTRRGGNRTELDSLRNRITSNVFATSERFEARQRSQQLATGSPWLADPREQSVSFAIWFAALYWELVSEFLEGNTDDDDTPTEVIAACGQMCAVADSWTDFAVRVQASGTGQVPAMSLQVFSAPPVTEASGRGIWRMSDVLCGHVERDWTALTLATIPRRFAEAERQLGAAMQPNLELMKYLRDQSLFATDAPAYVNLAKRAAAPTNELFQVGQKLWAPYLIGAAYTQARNKQPTIDDLDLGFDPWVLTDASTARVRRTDPASGQQLTAFWESLADPASGRRVAQGLATARQQRRIRYRSAHGYPFAPWPAQYLVRYPISFGGRSFVPGELISLFVTDAEPGRRAIEVRRSGRLTRRAELLGA